MIEIEQVVERAGGVRAIAAACGIHRTTVICWRKSGRVPLRHVGVVAGLIGARIDELRPDAFSLVKASPEGQQEIAA